MSRYALVAAALLGLTAVPAEAALPYCTVTLALADPGQSSSCETPDPDENGLVIRTLTFEVATGYVTGTLTCGEHSGSVSVAAPFSGSVTVVQRRFYSCTNTLTAVTPLSTAAGVSTYTVTHVEA